MAQCHITHEKTWNLKIKIVRFFNRQPFEEFNNACLEIMKSNILVIDGSGFLGSHIADELSSQANILGLIKSKNCPVIKNQK